MMKKNTKKIKAIKKLVSNFSGIKSEPCGRRTRKTIQLEVSSHEDITDYIATLLEVCYFALDGNGIFISSANKHCMPSSSVTKVIELIMELLPHSQMHCLDKISDTLNGKENVASEKKNDT
ncbi:hypothetical protein [Changchengzhania lutea]|uniref:hypothetical protein n=1 Tax=Changchengzhania lutea TaxID=2049305 RepID=UPI00115EE30E|nr:hypothetical protein [Changchengzhania lutea]